MNKVVTINLNGAAYQLEEAGYDTLRVYLESASRRLEANPDRAEIVADIEQAIADKFRALLTAHKNVIGAAEVTRIVTEMGPVEDGSTPAEPAAADSSPKPAAAQAVGNAPPSTVKRLYRLQEGEMVAGVCNGVAAYLNLDATIVRVIFVLLSLLSIFFTPGISFVGWYVVYGVLILVIPYAETDAEEAAARGGHDAPKTAQEFIRRAREGYYEGMKTWHDKHARREWKRKFKSDMRSWKHGFQQEVRRTGNQWGTYWQQAQSHPVQAPLTTAAAWVFLPIVALVHLALIGLWLLAVFSLINTGLVFGFALTGGLPLWEGIVVLALIYLILSVPLRIVRHGFLGYWRHAGHYPHPVTALCEALVWIGTIALIVWFATHHHSEVRHAIEQLPGDARHAVDSVRGWIHRHT